MAPTTEMKRIRVSLEPRDYEALRCIAEMHRPPTSRQYVAQYASSDFLGCREGRQLQLKGEDHE